MKNDKLYSWLLHFKLSSPEWQITPSYEAAFLVEILSIYLHVPLQYLKLFAVIEDCEDSGLFLESARSWIDTESSRLAVWHAGQALQVAKNFPRNTLRDFHATALCQVSLVLWSYGIASKAKQERGRNSAANKPLLANFATETVFLDGEESLEVRQFIVLGKGVAALGKVDSQPILMSDMSSVTEHVVGVLGGNFTEQPPPLVTNMVLLMKDLVSATRSVKKRVLV